jgi:hypothetical protein
MDAVISWPFKASVDASVGRLSLFDLERDPAETHDLSEALPGKSAEMLEKIESFKESQRTYYSLPAAVRSQLAPPRWQ